MKNSVTTNYRRNSDNSSEQIQRIVIFGLVYLSHRFCGKNRSFGAIGVLVYVERTKGR